MLEWDAPSPALRIAESDEGRGERKSTLAEMGWCHNSHFTNGKLKHRKRIRLIQGHTVSKQQGREQNPGVLSPSSPALSPPYHFLTELGIESRSLGSQVTCSNY